MSERARSDRELPYSPYFAHTVRRAWSLAGRRGSAFVGLEHLLFALLDDPDALALMEGCGADIASIRVEIGGVIEKNKPRKPLAKGETPEAGHTLQHVLRTAGHAAREAGMRDVDGSMALATLAGQSDNPVASMLNRHGLNFGKALGWIDSQSARAVPPSASAPAARRSSSPPSPPALGPAQKPRPKAQPPAVRENAGQDREPTLEDMLATIRDVIDEETDGRDKATARREAGSHPRSAPAQARSRRPPSPRGRPPEPERAASERRLARSSHGNGAAAPAAQPSRQTATGRGSERGALLGKLIERIPRIMREGVREQIEVRIAREATEALIAGVQGRGPAHVHGVAVTRAMSLYLRAPDGGFMIEPLTPETQCRRRSGCSTGPASWTASRSVAGSGSCCR